MGGEGEEIGRVVIRVQSKHQAPPRSNCRAHLGRSHPLSGVTYRIVLISDSLLSSFKKRLGHTESPWASVGVHSENSMGSRVERRPVVDVTFKERLLRKWRREKKQPKLNRKQEGMAQGAEIT